MINEPCTSATPETTPFITDQLTDFLWDKVPTSTQLFRKEAGVELVGRVIEKDCICAMCGAHLSAKDDPVPLALPVKEKCGDSFNNKMDIKFNGDVICGDCLSVWHVAFLQKNSKSYAIEGKGVYKLAKNPDIAAFVLTPPEASYVAIFNTRKQAHMIWRTPVQLHDSNTLVVRVDDNIIRINRENTLNAVRGWQYIEKRIKDLKLKTKAPALLSYDLSQTNTGMIFPVIITAMQQDGEEGMNALQSLQKLKIADWWALSALREVNLDKPETWPKPEKLNIILNETETETEVEEE